MPKRFPTLADMIRDLNATPREVAKALDVGESTVYRWLSIGIAPKPAMLALFWLTRWGESQIDVELWNRANVYQGLASALERKMWDLLEDIDRLGKIGDYGSANDPVSRLTRRYGLDGAGTFEPVEGTPLATINQAGHDPRFDRSKR